MKNGMKQMLENYSELIHRRPVTVFVTALLVTLILASGASKVQTVEQNQEDLLPDSLPTMKAFNTISSEFSSGSGTSYTILLTTQPEYANSTEIRDMRDPKALRFIKSMSRDIGSFNKVSSVSSASDLLKNIPSSKQRSRQVFQDLGEARWSQYVSKDYTSAVIRIQTIQLSNQERMEMANRIKESVKSHNKPAGIKASYTGQPFINQAFQEQTQKTMSLTGAVALIGVILVVVILFRSLFYGFASLLALVFGIATGFGLFGWLGLNMSPATSGAITMGIGVAIDFGIQPISRYIEERQDFAIEKSLKETIKGVITPMTVGLIAANIGFLSLNVGRVTFLSDLGTLLTLTTTMAYISAFTIIPSALVIYDRYIPTDKAKELTTTKLFQQNYTR